MSPRASTPATTLRGRCLVLGRVAWVAVAILTGGLLMSGRRLTSDSGEPDLWSNGSVFMGPREPISIDPSPHIPLQQTTARAVFKEDGPIGWDAKGAKPVVLTECCGLLSRKGSPFPRKAVVAFSSHKDTLFGVCTLLQRVGYKGMVQWAFSAQLTQWL